MTFKHPSQHQTEPLIPAFTAMSKHNMQYRKHVVAHALEQGYFPMNPFMMFGYFLSHLVDRDTIRRANNTGVTIAEKLLVYGTIADGVYAEILLAHDLKKPIEYFTLREINDKVTIKPVKTLDDIEIEPDVEINKLDLPHISLSWKELFQTVSELSTD